MSTELLVGYGALCTAIGTGIGLLIIKAADAKVRIIKAEADARKTEKTAELEAERACTDELQARVTVLENSHAECVKSHTECEKNLAHLQGYVDGKFDALEKSFSIMNQQKQEATQAATNVRVQEQLDDHERH